MPKTAEIFPMGDWKNSSARRRHTGHFRETSSLQNCCPSISHNPGERPHGSPATHVGPKEYTEKTTPKTNAHLISRARNETSNCWSTSRHTSTALVRARLQVLWRTRALLSKKYEDNQKMTANMTTQRNQPIVTQQGRASAIYDEPTALRDRFEMLAL